jgi:hypothetical protein
MNESDQQAVEMLSDIIRALMEVIAAKDSLIAILIKNNEQMAAEVQMLRTLEKMK